jgi:protein involved in polysaccharide export with SLBB domain
MIVAGLWAGCPEARAQEFGRLQEMREQTNVAYFYHARPGQATVQVQVQGTVPRPGIYEVADSTDLNKLLTMSGGAALEPRPENRERPEITIQVYRPSDQSRSVLLDVPFEQILLGERQFQEFQDGDIVVVETIEQRSFTWRDLLSISSTTLSIAVLALRIIRLRN